MNGSTLMLALNSGKGNNVNRNFLGAVKPSRMVGTFRGNSRKIGHFTTHHNTSNCGIHQGNHNPLLKVV